ncbi:DUF2264 domain-containing protein [Evansella sp. AB-rgal1]|uniref:DUF2264 domain-containing protein n=1 Tax=Evansella sp. AB-rgal1 TaxID=3242696 RepID=UPI00359D59F0
MKQIKENPLQTRQDVVTLLHQICEPLKNHFSEGSSRIYVGDTNAHYGTDIAGMEAFSRVLWGLVPLLAGEEESELLPTFVRGIINGTNPAHEEYWGKVGDYDQRSVEMAVFGYALTLIPEKVWEPLTDDEKDNVYHWLNQINYKEIVPSNWQFFRVLVNVGFETVGLPYDTEKQEESLAKIESYYMGDGWYSDGHNEQQDYYIPFAFHFYSLIYAKVMKEKDPERAERYKERAAIFAKDFLYWFGEDGSALPFGRSLSYRFSQGAFWSALAFADVEVMDWGVVKGLVLRHLRWWMKQPIFTKDGLLTIGYGYPNLLMSENYNGPGSPYWALKSFLVLALLEDHPIWESEEKPLPKLESLSVQKHPRMVICRSEDQQHVVSLTSGQFLKSIHGQNDAKYGKFAYSNKFGFCIQRGVDGAAQGAFDSMLALSERDGYYRVRKRCEVAELRGNVLYSLWKPWRDVSVETWLVPVNADWHVRVHRIDSERELNSMEGAFSVPMEVGESGRVSPVVFDGERGVSLPWGASGIVSLTGDRDSSLVRTDPNVNVLYSSPTFIPSLKGDVEKGVTVFGAAVYGFASEGDGAENWKDVPELRQDDNGGWEVVFKGKVITSI